VPAYRASTTRELAVASTTCSQHHWMVSRCCTTPAVRFILCVGPAAASLTSVLNMTLGERVCYAHAKCAWWDGGVLDVYGCNHMM